MSTTVSREWAPPWKIWTANRPTKGVREKVFWYVHGKTIGFEPSIISPQRRVKNIIVFYARTIGRRRVSRVKVLSSSCRTRVVVTWYSRIFYFSIISIDSQKNIGLCWEKFAWRIPQHVLYDDENNRRNEYDWTSQTLLFAESLCS